VTRVVSQLVVHPQTSPLVGSVPVPGDEQVLLPRLALAVLSRGKSSFLGVDVECRATRVFLDAIARFGVKGSAEEPEAAGAADLPAPVARGERAQTAPAMRWVIFGTGLHGMNRADAALDVRGEAQVAALLVGLLAGRPFDSELYVDEVVVEALAPVLMARGLAEVHQHDGGASLLLRGRPGRPPGAELLTTGLYPWVKQALLLLALRAETPTWIEEQLASPDHLERALLRARAPLEVVGSQVLLHPPRDDDALAPTTWEAVGSPELAAYLGAAASGVTGSRVEVRNVGTNPTRSAFLTLLRLLGGQVGFSPQGDRQGEPFGHVHFSSGELRPADLAGEQVVRLGDAALPLSVMLARAGGSSSLSDLVSSTRSADFRIFQRLGGYLMNAGVPSAVQTSGLTLEGSSARSFRGLRVTTGGDPRLALLASILGLFGDAPSLIDDVDCLRDVFPRWVGTLRALGARVEVQAT